jgi:hypothetical protein
MTFSLSTPQQTFSLCRRYQVTAQLKNPVNCPVVRYVRVRSTQGEANPFKTLSACHVRRGAAIRVERLTLFRILIGRDLSTLDPERDTHPIAAN